MNDITSNKRKEIETIDINKLASIEFTLEWKSIHATHTDSYFARKVNFWRDLLPEKLYNALLGRKKGDLIEFFHIHDEILQSYDPGNEFAIDHWQFDRQYIPYCTIEPRFGRFYPKGIPNVFEGNREQFRCTGVTETEFL